MKVFSNSVERLVWSDEFERLDEKKWSHLVTTHPPEDFQYYRDNRANSWVRGGHLHIMPTLTGLEYGEQFLYSGTLDLRREELGGRPCNIHYALTHIHYTLSQYSDSPEDSKGVFVS